MQYTVDAANRIVGLSDDWDHFAHENGGAPAAAEHVLGRPLFDFIGGDPTRLFVHAVLDGARTLGRTKVLPYRCDSPQERRWFEMTATPLPDGCVRVQHRLVAQHARPAWPQPEPPRQRTRRGWRCSQCLGWRLVGSSHWREEADEGTEVIGYDVCPGCCDRLFATPAAGEGSLHGD